MDKLPPDKIIQGAVDFARDAFLRDGAEGETVHLLCDVAGAYLAAKAACDELVAWSLRADAEKDASADYINGVIAAASKIQRLLEGPHGK